MSWSFVQRTPGGTQGSDVNTGSGTSLALTAFGSQPSIGDFIIVFAWNNDISGNTIAATDNGSTPNSYTKLVSGVSAQIGVGAIFVAKVVNLPNTGNLQSSITNSANVTMTGCAAEFAGGTLLTDGSNNANGSTGTPAPGSITTTVPNDLILAVLNAPTTSPTTPTGFTNVGAANGSNGGQGVYQIAGGTGSFNPSWANGSSPWAAAVVALQSPVQMDDEAGITFAVRFNWLRRLSWRQRITGLWLPGAEPIWQGAA